MMTVKDKILAILLALAFNAFAAAWTGASTEPSNMKTIEGKKYYVINNADELAWFSDQVNNGQTTLNAYLNQDIYFASNKDSLCKIAWSPIGGTESSAFNGIFEGNNHGIYGLLSNKENSSLYGFFGIIGENGVVRNLIVNVSVISANNRNGYYNYTNDLSGLEKIYLGGIAAINNGKIENCHTFGSIIGNSLQYAQNLNGGGIVGWNKGVIRSVSSNQSAISVYTFSYDAKYYAGSCGGVVGVNEGVIDKCINKGAVTGRNYIGGITGSNGVSAMIYNCINEGNFSNTKERVGSLVGYNYGVLKTSYSVASSFLIWGTGKQIGAVIGANYGDANTCYFDSDFLADFTAVGYGAGVNVSGKTTVDMQKDQFAWILNTANGSEENDGIWSRYDGYPVFSNDTLLPIRKIAFDDGENVSVYYTNYKGLISVYPEIPQAPEGKAFAGWVNSSDEDVNLTTVFLKDQTITAKFLDWEDVVYSIKFLDEKGNVLDLQSAHSGETPVYGAATPTKKSTVAYTYTFKGWSPEIAPAVWHTDYTVMFDSTINQYKVSYVDYDGTELFSSMFDYGTKPTYSTIPKKTNTVAYLYSFAGWSPAVENVSGEAVYKAVYDSVLQKYSIEFKANGETLLSKDYDYGSVPKYEDATPTKPATKAYSYSFAGWEPEIAKVTEATSYTAKFDSSLNKYMVVFQNGAKVLQGSEIEYGKVPVYEGETPKKTSTAKYDYSFSSWSPALTKVTDEATYTALFDSTLRSYEVSFVSEGETLLAKEYEYGTLPKFEGNEPSKKESKGFTYSFKGWNPSVAMVKDKAVYTAVFDSVAKTFVVTFMNGKDTLQSTAVSYGNTPEYKGKTPTKTSSDKYEFKFSGWSPALTKVTDEATYTALFDSTLRSYEVSFVSEGETLLAKEYEYGTLPKFEGNEPSKKESKGFTYSFKSWNPSVAMVKDKAVYTAVFDSVAKTFVVTFMNGKDTLQSTAVAYGDTPEYKGKTPTKIGSDKYEFKFSGWSPKLATVTEEAVYKAVFDSTKLTGIANVHLVDQKIKIMVISRDIQISAAPIGKTFALFDMQGRVLQKGYIEVASFNVIVPRSGSYFIRIGNQIKKVDVK